MILHGAPCDYPAIGGTIEASISRANFDSRLLLLGNSGYPQEEQFD
jgi:hypothetical protein